MDDTYKLLDLNPEETTTLEQYLQVCAASLPVDCLGQHECQMSCACFIRNVQNPRRSSVCQAAPAAHIAEVLVGADEC